MRAALNYQWEIMALLIQKGADITLISNDGDTALDCLALRRKSLRKGSIGSIIALIMRGYYTQERYNRCVRLLSKSRL